MISCSEQQRVACAIGGVYTALSIEKVLPIMHSGPGCLQNSGGVLGRFNGCQSGVSYPDSIVPSTNFCDKDVVFGAADRLRRLVKKSLEYYKTDMVVLVDGCSSEIVGDDIEEVASDFTGSSIPVIYAKLPGFKGNNLWGHAQVLNGITDQYLKNISGASHNRKQVNVFGVVPYFDSFWMAELEELEVMLRTLGLEPNIIYGRGKGIEAVKKIPQAAFNLVLAPWTDLEFALRLQEAFDTPFFHYPCLPIGPTETARFVRSLAEFAKLDPRKAEDYIKQEEERYYFFVRNGIRVFVGGPKTPRRFYINSSASRSVSLTRFLANDWGMTPAKVFITDDVPAAYQDEITGALRDIECDDAENFEILFTNDGGLCDQELAKEIFPYRRVCLFGTCWDQLTANNKRLPFLPVSAPYGDTAVGNTSYLGYNGALTFIRDLYRDMTQKILGSGVVAKLDEAAGH
jgi:nitrogenase molybdenum-iron protein beta chain